MNIQQIPTTLIRAVFTDLDDTLTDHSQILAPTYDCLWKLKEAGLWLAIISGRPAGWADCLMRLWPLDAMVFENGAGIMVREGKKRKTISLCETRTISDQRKYLGQVLERLRKIVPDLKMATDQPYRLCDMAIDFNEEPPHLSEAQVDRLLEELRKDKSITAKLSSIHINFWYGSHTKVTACAYLLRHVLQGHTIGKENVLFCGDSPNDEPLFEFFPHSVGVANIERFLNRMEKKPAYLCVNRGGLGFQELTAALLN